MRVLAVVGLVLLAAAAVAAVPLLRWQQAESDRTRCQSNLRRVSLALLLYSQDFDGRFPPVQQPVVVGQSRWWVDLVLPYSAREDYFVCPSNPADHARDPDTKRPFPYSYALNRRFFGVFFPGPFPIENLELSAQTALVVESGPLLQPNHAWSAAEYWDTGATPNAYPSPHSRRMTVAAADGHVVSLKIAHYSPTGHDALYGRLGGSIFNWNGGHPNDDTAGPPLE